MLKRYLDNRYLEHIEYSNNEVTLIRRRIRIRIRIILKIPIDKIRRSAHLSQEILALEYFNISLTVKNFLKKNTVYSHTHKFIQ